MQLMMLKGSLSSLPSYKYGRFKPNFFSGTNDDKEDVEDAACVVFGSCHDHIDIHYFDATIHGENFKATAPVKQEYVFAAVEYSSPAPSKAKYALA